MLVPDVNDAFLPPEHFNKNDLIACRISVKDTLGQEATPLVVDGVMYTTSAWSHVLAVDAASGQQLWHFDPQVPKEMG